MNWERLARAFTHPLRVSILEVLAMDGGRVLSPSDLSNELQMPLSNVSYHVGELRRANLVELAFEQPVRGATEHFYSAVGDAGRGKAGRKPATPGRARVGRA